MIGGNSGVANLIASWQKKIAALTNQIAVLQQKIDALMHASTRQPAPASTNLNQIPVDIYGASRPGPLTAMIPVYGSASEAGLLSPTVRQAIHGFSFGVWLRGLRLRRAPDQSLDSGA